MKSKSYKPCRCGAECVRLGESQTEPCWGQVYVIDCDFDKGEPVYVHACQGHGGGINKMNADYKPEPQ